MTGGSSLLDLDGDEEISFGDAVEVMMFDMDGLLLACDITFVDEVLKEFKMTRVPNVEDASISGVINLRGHILPVMDLSVKMGREARIPAGDWAGKAILVTRLPGVNCGLLVDGVKNIASIPRGEISKNVSMLSTTISRAHVSGVFKAPGSAEITMMLDVPSIVGRKNGGDAGLP